MKQDQTFWGHYSYYINILPLNCFIVELYIYMYYYTEQSAKIPKKSRGALHGCVQCTSCHKHAY